MIKLSASINPCIEEQAVEYSKELQNIGVDFLHLDVMRSNFVGHDALQLDTIKEIYDNTLLPLDVHLMINEPLQELKDFIKLKPNYITVHYEAFKNKNDLLKAINMIHKAHILAGISIKPNTFVEDIKPFLSNLDLVLVMGVEPGLSGQTMVSNTIPKVKQLRDIITEYAYDMKIEVDGGVNEKNMKELYENGADMLVFGSRLFNAVNKQVFVNKVHGVK